MVFMAFRGEKNQIGLMVEAHFLPFFSDGDINFVNVD